MGTAESALVQEVRPSWECDHRLDADPELRREQLSELGKFKKDLRMCYIPRKLHDILYSHFFITDGLRVLEFGNGDSSGGSVRIALEKARPGEVLEKSFELTEEVRSRMRKVCGATSFSLPLRNSEHVCRYVQSGTWYSLQMTGDGPLGRELHQAMGDKTAHICTPPSELKGRSSVLEGPIYQEWCSRFNVTYKETRDALTRENATDYNIVVLGPTGAGKSAIINLLFNQKVAKVQASASALPVTKNMHIYSGTFLPMNSTTPSVVNVVDSIGFCNSVMPPADVLEVVKAFIKSSVLHVHKVVVVCAGNIEHEQACAIKELLHWLGYQNHQENFVFVRSKKDGLEVDEKTTCLDQMCTLLGVTATLGVKCEVESEEVEVDYAISTAFPPSAPHKGLKGVAEDLRDLYNAVFLLRERAWAPSGSICERRPPPGTDSRAIHV